jgi:hypothetical protein
MLDSVIQTGLGKAAGLRIWAHLNIPPNLQATKFVFQIDGYRLDDREERERLEHELQDAYDAEGVYAVRITDGTHRSGVHYLDFHIHMKSSLLH